MTRCRLSDIGVSPVISCIFTTLFYMIISRWNQFTHMFIDIFFSFNQPIDCRGGDSAPQLPKRASLPNLLCFTNVTAEMPLCFPADEGDDSPLFALSDPEPD